MVWDRPTRSRELVNWSVRLSRLPVTMPSTTPPSSAGKAARMPSFSIRESTAGQYRQGKPSRGSTSSRP